MRRPLCVFCAGMLGVALVCDFLPQTELFVPFAAFFVAVCLLLCIPDRTRKALLCLLLGAAAGLAAARHTNARLEQTLEKYAGQTVALTAEVESVSASYYPGIVDAVLRVERVNGRAAEFRVECDTLPVCEAGERVEGRFALEAPEPADRTTLFADGVALLAKEPQAFARLGQGSSFRARTSRLQKRLSTSLRGEMNEDAGGVLAAMTVGDRNHLSSALRSAYRGAGLSHVLVVSGMHVSILCGDVFGRRRRERSYRSRRVKVLFTAFLALLLAGVTGFTPSVCRAAVAVWVSALGVWVYGASDALTSLAAAGILMTARNSYAVCDIGFELSFAAVLGTLAGAELSRRLHALFAAHATRKKKPAVLQRILRHVRSSLTETVCIGVCASAAAFPVLVLRGLSVSIYAVLSGVAVLWMVKPMMLLGLGTAFAGLVPAAGPLYTMIGKAAEFLTGLLNRWAVWVSAKPGAGLYFDTNYAAIVCLLLMALCGLAHVWKVRLRVAVPGLLLTAALAIGAGNALCRDVVHVDLVGSANRVMSGQKFTTLFIDEAAQALEAACWIPMKRTTRVVFAGDHCQLPPTVKSIEAMRGGLAKTLMERIVENKPEVVTLLTVQYRMNEKIMQFSSEWFYDGKVIAAPEVCHRGILDYDLPMMWIDTSGTEAYEQFVGESFGRINKKEAALTLEKLQEYFEKTGKQRILDESIDVGIISPYRAQVQYLRQQIKKKEFFRPYRKLISVNTVDGFQGQERDIIIISLVRSNNEGQIGFLSDLRRMNVAITRARMKLIIMGNAETLSHTLFYKKLYEYVMQISNGE